MADPSQFVRIGYLPGSGWNRHDRV